MAEIQQPHEDEQPEFDEECMNAFKEYVPQMGIQSKQIQEADLEGIQNRYDIEAATYQGDFNGMAQRHGQGTCTNEDGSTYKGQWEYNLKSGVGEIHFQDGAKFEGIFVKGKRNGPGKLYMADGSIIEATWTNDMINGEGLHIKSNGEQVKCIFYNNSKIEVSNNQTEGCYDRSGLSFCFFITFWSLLIQSGITKSGVSLSLGLLFFSCNMCECCTSITYKYISNTIAFSEISVHLNKLKSVAPEIRFHIECYHYRTVRTSKGRTQRRKVVTHRASEFFRYTQWIDKSADINSMEYVVKMPLARFEVVKFFDFSSSASASYKWQKNDFFKRHKRDRHQNTWQVETLHGHVPYQLVINDREGVADKSCWFNKYIFKLVSLLGLSWVIRIYFIKKVTKVSYTSHKLIVS